MNPVKVEDIQFVGQGLVRPECVLAAANGRIYTADWRGGVAVREPDGNQWLLAPEAAGFALRPNGICLMPDGAFLIAHLGDTDGGVFRIDDAGGLSPFLTEVEGEALPPVNYVHRDPHDRVWITVSTRLVPRDLGYRPDVADGFVVLVDRRGARVVADGLGYTNECLVHPDGRRLLVNETFGRRLTAFEITDDGRLTNPSVVTDFGVGTFPDGLAFDAEGGVWITSIVSNRLIRIAGDGTQQQLLEDVDPDYLERVEAAFQAGTMGRSHLDKVKSRRLPSISSLAFAGRDLRTALLGCLLGDAIASFRSPVAGYPPSHWQIAGPRRPN